jgi:hypothetical protein
MQASYHYGFDANLESVKYNSPSGVFPMAIHLQGYGVPKNRPYGISITIPVGSTKDTNIYEPPPATTLAKKYTSWPYSLLKSYGSDNCAYFPILLARIPTLTKSKEFLVLIPSKTRQVYIKVPTKPRSPAIENLTSFYEDKIREAGNSIYGYEVKTLGNGDNTILTPQELVFCC